MTYRLISDILDMYFKTSAKVLFESFSKKKGRDEMKDTKATQKQINGLIFIKEVGSICSQQAIKDYKERLKVLGFDTNKINSFNATQASNASKGWLNKVKKVYNDKLCTFYTLTDKGLEVLDQLEESN